MDSSPSWELALGRVSQFRDSVTVKEVPTWLASTLVLTPQVVTTSSDVAEIPVVPRALSTVPNKGPVVTATASLWKYWIAVCSDLNTDLEKVTEALVQAFKVTFKRLRQNEAQANLKKRKRRLVLSQANKLCNLRCRVSSLEALLSQFECTGQA